MGVWLRIFFKNYLKASPHVRKKLLPILLISIRRCLARGRGGVPPPLRRFAAMAVPVPRWPQPVMVRRPLAAKATQEPEHSFVRS